MSVHQLRTLIRRLRQAADPGHPGALTDAQLLDRWAGRRDQAAFEVLLWRHGPMVLGVCRRLLRNPDDVDDAFQATFLVLVRKAGSIRRRGAVAAWLYRVAYRVALRARAEAARRAAGALPGGDVPAPAGPDEVAGRDLRGVLDEEIDRLPEVCRRAFVLCCLEGRTVAETARLLGRPEGTVSSWLSRARHKLRARLSRRGLALSAGVPALLALGGPSSAGVPVPLVISTLEAAARFAAAPAAVPGRAVALAEGALKTMLLTKLKVVTTAVVLAALVGLGGGGLAYRQLMAAPPPETGRTTGEAPARKEGAGEAEKKLYKDQVDAARKLLLQDTLDRLTKENEDLKKAVQKLEAELARVKQRQAHLAEELRKVAPLTRQEYRKAPAPQKKEVWGIVREVTPSGLVKIDIGNNVGGVREGMVLHVYRLKPRPDYLGTLKILAYSPSTDDVSPGRGVGKPPKGEEKIRPGDQVTDRMPASR